MKISYLFISLIVFGGIFVQRVSGFGFAIVAMVFLPRFFPVLESAALVGMVSMVSNFIVAGRYAKTIRFLPVLIPTIAYFILSFLVLNFAADAGTEFLKKVLGGVMVVFCLFFLFLQNRIRIPANTATGLVCGSLSGAMGGLFSTSGPPMVVYYLSACKDNAAYLACIQAYFFLTSLYSTVHRAVSGIVTNEVMICFAISIPRMILGNYVGGKLFDSLNRHWLNRIVYGTLGVSGVLYLLGY